MEAMKLSRWNSYIDLPEGGGLIFNALTESFIAVRKGFDDYLNVKENRLESFSDSFREKMIASGMLVEETKDEVEELSRIIEEIDNDESMLRVIVNPTLDCNFHCWYCYENHQKDSCMNPDMVGNLLRYMDKKVKSSEKLKDVSLSFFGGEPLMRFEEVVKPVMDGVSEICRESGVRCEFGFTSNSFLIDDSMLTFFKRYRPMFQITLDGGREQHNNTRFGKGKEPTFDIILDNVRKLAEQGSHVALRINYTSKVIDSTTEIVDIISGFPETARKNITVDFQRVWQDIETHQEDESYSKARMIRNDLKSKGFMVSNNRLINQVRNSCYGDKRNEVLVNFNGDLFACTARDFVRENRLGVLSEDGELKWDAERREQRMKLKFSKEICHNCRIAPICGGGCRTKCVEHQHHDRCNVGYTEEAIDELIMERFEERYMLNQKPNAI